LAYKILITAYAVCTVSTKQKTAKYEIYFRQFSKFGVFMMLSLTSPSCEIIKLHHILIKSHSKYYISFIANSFCLQTNDTVFYGHKSLSLKFMTSSV